MNLKCAEISEWGKSEWQERNQILILMKWGIQTPPKLSICSGDSWTNTSSGQTVSSLFTPKGEPMLD